MGSIGEFIYKLPGTPGGYRPGAHRSQSLGPGLAFATHQRLFDQPDPRRLDLRASLRDVRREWLVRVNRQHSSVAVHVIFDVSASMHFGAQRSKFDVAKDFIESLGYSAFRYGDSVGLMAFDETARADLHLPPKSSRGTASLMLNKLAACTVYNARKGSAAGLSDCVDNLSTRCPLLFLVSDFHWPLDTLAAILKRLGTTFVVPIVVWDPAEVRPPPTGRWLSINDMESGKSRHLWLRKSTRTQWEANVAHRRQLLEDQFSHQHIKPYYLQGQFEPESLTQYFMDNSL